MKQRLLSVCASTRVLRVLLFLEIAAALTTVSIELAWAHHAEWMPRVLSLANLVLLLAFSVRMIARLFTVKLYWREPSALAAIVGALLFGFVTLRLAALVALLHDGYLGWRWLRRESSTERVLVDIGNRPARSLVISFATLILIGSFLLSLPAASAGPEVRFIDALFTAVSATCVTGLTTLDTASTWSPFGLLVIAALIQAGGLGVMTITAFMSLTLSRELGLQRNALLRGAFDEPDAEQMKGLVRGIVISTLAIEGLGAAMLSAHFVTIMPWREALTSAAFHSLSAFCNAGFSLYTDNLVRFAGDPFVNLVIASLVLLGGAGFGVLVAFARYVRAPRTTRVPIHARLVVVTSLLLVFGGAVAFFFFEYNRSLAHLELFDKVVAAFFHSVVARTAGFNTVTLTPELVHPVSILVVSTLMFIGASPGSTGGGIKTTTAAIMFLAARAVLLERETVEVFGRRLPSALVLRALALTGGAALTLVMGFGLLLVTEEASFSALLFEATSALGTVGLSLGLTPMLSDPGRLLICALMFVGRIGPLTALAAATTLRMAPARLTLPEGRVLVG